MWSGGAKQKKCCLKPEPPPSPGVPYPDQPERLTGRFPFPLPRLLRRRCSTPEPGPVPNRRLPRPPYPGGEFSNLRWWAGTRPAGFLRDGKVTVIYRGGVGSVGVAVTIEEGWGSVGCRKEKTKDG